MLESRKARITSLICVKLFVVIMRDKGKCFFQWHCWRAKFESLTSLERSKLNFPNHNQNERTTFAGNVARLFKKTWIEFFTLFHLKTTTTHFFAVLRTKHFEQVNKIQWRTPLSMHYHSSSQSSFCFCFLTTLCNVSLSLPFHLYLFVLLSIMKFCMYCF